MGIKKDIDAQLEMLFSFGRGELFYSFANADGKRWIMPSRNMGTAMNLYQPSGIRGKLVKTLLPLLSSSRIVLRLIHAERMRLAFSDELSGLFEKLFGTKDLEFSVFCGTPCVHRKITVQVSKGKEILGYAKFTASEDIMQVFVHEKKVLDFLHAKHISDVPECRYCGRMSCGLGAFVQTTAKTSASRVLHKWTKLHGGFLNSLYKKTRKKMEYTETDFYNDMKYLSSHTFFLEDEDRKAVTEILTEVNGYFMRKGTVDFCVCHMDFTPWNMFEDRGRLFVFDWEYSRLSYPANMDVWHFFVQTSRFEKHLDGEAVWHRYHELKYKVENISVRPMPDLPFKCYLLAVISLYIRREGGKMTDSLHEDIGMWLYLLRKFN